MCTVIGVAALLATRLPLRADPGLQEGKVTLGPGVLTFAEIAGRLSVDGRVVRLHPGLENSAAYVYLKARPWSAARDLLATALDLRFAEKQGDPNRWEMRRDRGVEERGARWRRELTANLYQQLRERWRDRQLNPQELDNFPSVRIANAWFATVLPQLPPDIVQARQIVQVGPVSEVPAKLVGRLLEAQRQNPAPAVLDQGPADAIQCAVGPMLRKGSYGVGGDGFAWVPPRKGADAGHPALGRPSAPGAVR